MAASSSHGHRLSPDAAITKAAKIERTAKANSLSAKTARDNQVSAGRSLMKPPVLKHRSSAGPRPEPSPHPFFPPTSHQPAPNHDIHTTRLTSTHVANLEWPRIVVSGAGLRQKWRSAPWRDDLLHDTLYQWMTQNRREGRQSRRPIPIFSATTTQSIFLSQ